MQKDDSRTSIRQSERMFDDFVLEKGIFSKVFEKDIRRVYIYKRAERLAKAVHLICPAFAHHSGLRDKIDAISVGIVSAAASSTSEARKALSGELLALSSLLSIARAGGILSQMNVEIIAREAHALLEEIAEYEEPLVLLENQESMQALQKRRQPEKRPQEVKEVEQKHSIGQIKDKDNRSELILSFISSNGPSYIKDIAKNMPNVGEKTIQRKLKTLVENGTLLKEGDRRWTKYRLA